MARALASKLRGTVLDTGALYRAVAWQAREHGISWDADNEARLGSLARELSVEFRPASSGQSDQQVWLGKREVTREIRENQISDGASRVSALPEVRAALLDLQRKIALAAIENGVSCVAEGRDMGTVVFPEADKKFFLTASLDERAERRARELEQRNPGKGPKAHDVKTELEARDQRDSSRDVAPLKPAEDAVLIDSSGLSFDEVIQSIWSRL